MGTEKARERWRNVVLIIYVYLVILIIVFHRSSGALIRKKMKQRLDCYAEIISFLKIISYFTDRRCSRITYTISSLLWLVYIRNYALFKDNLFFFSPAIGSWLPRTPHWRFILRSITESRLQNLLFNSINFKFNSNEKMKRAKRGIKCNQGSGSDLKKKRWCNYVRCAIC